MPKPLVDLTAVLPLSVIPTMIKIYHWLSIIDGDEFESARILGVINSEVKLLMA